MPGVFDGIWNIDYHLVVGKDQQKIKTINIAYVARNFYKFIICFGGEPLLPSWEFTIQPDGDGMSFSQIQAYDWGQRGVRIVFNSPIDPQKIVDGPLCSKAEWWSPHSPDQILQPSDMGTFTGTKG